MSLFSLPHSVASRVCPAMDSDGSDVRDQLSGWGRQGLTLALAELGRISLASPRLEGQDPARSLSRE